MPNRPALRILPPALLVLGLLATGCGSHEQSSAGPDAPAASSTGGGASTSPSASVSGSPSGSGSASTSPAVAPATGPVVESDAFTANLPTGWTLDEVNRSSTLALGYDPDSGADMTLGYFPAASGSTLDSYEQAALKTWTYDSGPKIRPRVDVNGVEMFHHSGTEDPGRVVELYGTPHAGLAVELEFFLPDTLPRAERRKIVESVLATVEWK